LTAALAIASNRHASREREETVMGGMPKNYTTTFYDDFSGSKLDPHNWPLVYGGNSSNGAYVYTHSSISTGNGLTIMIADDGGTWTTGGISQGTRGGTYGLYQVEAKVSPGHGTGPIILLWPDNNQWPPEIDLLEAPDGKGPAYMTLHWAGAYGQNEYTTINTHVNVNSYHDYAVDWEPSRLTFYIDGKQMWTTTQHIPDIPMALVLSNFVAANGDSWYGSGPNGSTPSPIPFKVAWAAISQPADRAAAAAPEQNDPGITVVTSAALGQSSSGSSQVLASSKGSDILLGGNGADVFYAAMANPDGWTEIDHWHAGDVAVFVGAVPGRSTITWAGATDPNARQGATASISLRGDGHIDATVTFVGINAAQLGTFTWQSTVAHEGTPYLAAHDIGVHS
jgi:beta-glucanase (GH16 family)